MPFFLHRPQSGVCFPHLLFARWHAWHALAIPGGLDTPSAAAAAAAALTVMQAADLGSAFSINASSKPK